MQDALSRLKWCSSLGDVLWFGFGFQHPIRVLAQTANGFSCLALCASLSEGFSDLQAAAMILTELVDIQGAPQELRPSPQQWHALIKCCSGAIAATPFGSVADHFMGLSGATEKAKSVGDPREIAKALRAIGSLSTGTLTSIHLTGNPMCGWLAAFGHYFFGLEIEIQHADGNLLFRTVSDLHPVNISVTYGDSGALGVRVASTSYIIDNVPGLIMPYKSPFFGGRIKWEEAIRATFGRVGNTLLDAKQSFGILVGSAARVFAAIAKADPQVNDFLFPKVLEWPNWRNKKPFHLLEKWVGYSSDSFGQGYIRFATTTLPELAEMKDRMTVSVQVTLLEALSNYKTASTTLASICPCDHCRVKNFPYEDDWEDETEVQCVPILAEAIIGMIWHLSLLDFHTDLLPTRRGLKSIWKVWERPPPVPGKDRDIGNIATLLQNLDITALCGIAESLFAGSGERRAATYFDTSPAFSSRGLCFIRSTLIDITDRPDQSKILQIIPGVIELRSGTQYQRVIDAPKTSFGYDAENYQDITDLTTHKNTASGSLKTELIVQETLEKLLISFRFSSSKGEIFLGPAELSDSILRSVGDVYCRQKHCEILAPPFPTVSSLDGEGAAYATDDRNAGRSIVIRQLAGNPLARCLATMIVRSRNSHGQSVALTSDGAILRLDECLSCCIKAARLSPHWPVYIIT